MKITSMIIVTAMGLGVAATQAFSTPSEMLDMQAWVNAKFGDAAQSPPLGSLQILTHFDIVWQNCRVDRPLTLGNREYSRGLFTHAPSDVLVKLPESGREFTAYVGIDTNDQIRGGRGSVIFTVVTGDNKEVFKSPVVCEGMAPVPVRVALDGATEFHLQVNNAGDDNSCDQADWVDAKVTLEDGRILWLGDMLVADAPKEACYADTPN